jgi:DNA polymerase-3 subunit gamma/tau
LVDRETVQLLYQISVQGRNDLPVAPDEYSGFVMTLLRMIAFRLDDQEVRAASGGDAQLVSTRHAVSASVKRGAIGGWAALVGRLQITGAARELARNAELIAFDGNRVELRVPASLAYLAEKAYQDKLKVALEADLGAQVVLKVTAGEVKGESAAALEQGERDARRADAARVVHGDRFVREVVNLFDGAIVEQSIRPAPGTDGRKTSG